MKSCCKDAFANDEEIMENTSEKSSGLQKLRDKWQVKNILQVVLILCTFALGGSLCAYCGRKIMALTTLSGGTWLFVYILLVTALWPLCVLLISIPFGQFSFFKKYLAQLGRKIAGKNRKPKTPQE